MTQRIVTLSSPIPAKPTVTQVDEIMRAASEQLGETWHAVRLSGCWVFQRQGTAGIVSRRRFEAAMADSLGATIVTEI